MFGKAKISAISYHFITALLNLNKKFSEYKYPNASTNLNSFGMHARAVSAFTRCS